MAEVLAAGIDLFSREVMKRRFGDGEVVDALQKQTRQNKRLRELTRLEKRITAGVPRPVCDWDLASEQ